MLLTLEDFNIQEVVVSTQVVGVDRDSLVGIATGYRLDGLWIESIQTGPEAQPASYTMGTGSLSQG
jgi:hypothetical protein